MPTMFTISFNNSGMEVAAYLTDKASSISCIDITAVPFERVLGDRVGKMLQGVSTLVKRDNISPVSNKLVCGSAKD